LTLTKRKDRIAVMDRKTFESKLGFWVCGILYASVFAVLGITIAFIAFQDLETIRPVILAIMGACMGAFSLYGLFYFWKNNKGCLDSLPVNN